MTKRVRVPLTVADGVYVPDFDFKGDRYHENYHINAGFVDLCTDNDKIEEQLKLKKAESEEIRKKNKKYPLWEYAILGTCEFTGEEPPGTHPKSTWTIKKSK